MMGPSFGYTNPHHGCGATEASAHEGLRMSSTTMFRFVPACLCACLLAAGCSKPKAEPTAPAAPDEAEALATFDASELLAAPKAAADPAKALVTVNGEGLTYGAADTMTRRMLAAQGATAEQMYAIMQQMGDSSRDDIADQFIVATLLKQEAVARKIDVSDAELDSAVSKLTARLPPDTDLQTALKRMGMTEEQFRKDIRDNERIRKLFDSETEQVPTASDEEIAAFYNENAARFTQGEEVTARHILIGAQDVDDAEKAKAKAKAEELRKQLVEGADFAALAAANSDCPSKAEGGSLGSFGRGRMVPAFEQAAFALATNAISEVVETPFGFHIIQVTDRSEGGKKSLEEVREQIAEQLARKKKNEVFESLIEGLRAKATIVQDKPAEAETEEAAEVPAAVTSEPVATPAEATPAEAEEAPAAAEEAPAKAEEAPAKAEEAPAAAAVPAKEEEPAAANAPAKAEEDPAAVEAAPAAAEAKAAVEAPAAAEAAPAKAEAAPAAVEAPATAEEAPAAKAEEAAPAAAAEAPAAE